MKLYKILPKSEKMIKFPKNANLLFIILYLITKLVINVNSQMLNNASDC